MWRKMWRAYRGKGRFYSQDAFPGLPLDVVVTHILGSANLPDPIDLARLRAVGRGMRVAVDVTGRKVEELEAWEAASRGYFSTLEHLHSRGHLWETKLLCEACAASGQLDELMPLHAKRCPWGETCMEATRGGHLEVLKWAHENGCPWDQGTCRGAALRGHLEVLQWAHVNGCPWDTETTTWAAWAEHLEMLQWAHANGAPWNKSTCNGAAGGGHFEILKWAHTNGCPLGKRAIGAAVFHGNYEMLQWLLANGCPEYDRDDESDND